MAELNRRRLLSGAVVIGGVAVLSRAPSAGAISADEFAALEDRYNAHIGLFAVNLESPQAISWRENDRFAMCSTFKTYAAGRVLQMSDRGQLRVDEAAPVAAGDILPNSPVTEQAVGRTLTLGELCAAALRQHLCDLLLNVPDRCLRCVRSASDQRHPGYDRRYQPAKCASVLCHGATQSNTRIVRSAFT
jgi:hypothetical protein